MFSLHLDDFESLLLVCFKSEFLRRHIFYVMRRHILMTNTTTDYCWLLITTNYFWLLLLRLDLRLFAFNPVWTSIFVQSIQKSPLIHLPASRQLVAWSGGKTASYYALVWTLIVCFLFVFLVFFFVCLFAFVCLFLFVG